MENVERPVKEKRSLIKAKKLQKKYGVNCKIGSIFKNSTELDSVFEELQREIGYKVKRITFENGRIVSAVIDKNNPLLP
ncbi:hypothetical protein KAS08_00480 [Candidatus Pacearchaeota archaeon]|nr:hypothetical protein [Candidatus Pacearchaeota archaeon]